MWLLILSAAAVNAFLILITLAGDFNLIAEQNLILVASVFNLTRIDKLLTAAV